MEFSNVIPTVELGSNDVLIVHLGVGQMPPYRVKEYIAEITPGLKERFGDQPLMILPAPEKFTSFSIIHRPDCVEGRKVFHIDIEDNIPQEEVKQHLERIRESIKSRGQN